MQGWPTNSGRHQFRVAARSAKRGQEVQPGQRAGQLGQRADLGVQRVDDLLEQQLLAGQGALLADRPCPRRP